jgi:multidrug resistance efflux pump
VAYRDAAHKEKELSAVEASDPQVYVREAEAGVKQAEELQRKAQLAIDLCTIKAKSAGTIERVTIGPGSTLGIGTREPALWLIPSGKRIVRAEIEAEFAHKVGKELEGKDVMIFDNTDSRLSYRGKVRTISGTFLPKRAPSDSLLTGSTSVLEAVIEIADPAPPKIPPLRVGQRVRVGMGQ